MMIGTSCLTQTSMSCISRSLEAWTIWLTAKGAILRVGSAALAAASSALMRVSQTSSWSAGRAFSAGNEPTTPTRHCAMTSSGPETMNIGEPMTGQVERVGKGSGEGHGVERPQALGLPALAGEVEIVQAVEIDAGRLLAQQHLARPHQMDIVGDRERDMGVLLDQRDRDALGLEPADDAEDLLDDHRRQAERGLVDQQDARLAHHAAAHRDHLRLAARERAGQLGAALLQAREQARRRARDCGRAPCGSGADRRRARDSPRRSCP